MVVSASGVTPINRYSEPIDFTVANLGGIEKGALLQLVDPRTASGPVPRTAGAKCAGVARREKISGDGRTQLSIIRDGVVEVMASGPIPIGEAVMMSETPNHVTVANAAATASGPAAVIGHALETAATDEVFQIQLQLA